MLGLGILTLRITVGLVMIAHALPKLFWKRKLYNEKWRNEYGFPLGSVLLTGILQLVGGIAIILGVYTRLAAIFLVINMLVATYISIRRHGESFLSTPDGKGWDVNYLLIGALVALIFLGGGTWSLVGW
jgi:putative oxidoreductase